MIPLKHDSLVLCVLLIAMPTGDGICEVGLFLAAAQCFGNPPVNSESKLSLSTKFLWIHTFLMYHSLWLSDYCKLLVCIQLCVLSTDGPVHSPRYGKWYWILSLVRLSLYEIVNHPVLVSGDIHMKYCLNPIWTEHWNRPQSACSPCAIKDNECACGIVHVDSWGWCTCWHVIEEACFDIVLISGAICDVDNVGCSIKKPPTKASGAVGNRVCVSMGSVGACAIPLRVSLIDDSANPCSMNSCWYEGTRCTYSRNYTSSWHSTHMGSDTCI